MKDVISVSALIALGILLSVFVFGLTAMWGPHTPMKVYDQIGRCHSMGGRDHVTKTDGTYKIECYRHTFFMRTPKLLFELTIDGDKDGR